MPTEFFKAFKTIPNDPLKFMFFFLRRNAALPLTGYEAQGSAFSQRCPDLREDLRCPIAHGTIKLPMIEDWDCEEYVKEVVDNVGTRGSHRQSRRCWDNSEFGLAVRRRRPTATGRSRSSAIRRECLFFSLETKKTPFVTPTCTNRCCGRK